MTRYWVEDGENAGEWRVIVREQDRPIVERVVATYDSYDVAADAMEELEAIERRYRCLAAGVHDARDITRNCWRCR